MFSNIFRIIFHLLHQIIIIFDNFQLQQQVAAKEGTQKMERIQNEIHLEKEKALADAEFYKKERDGKYSSFFLFLSLLAFSVILS